MTITIHDQLSNGSADDESDGQLLSRMHQGDSVSFEALFHRHYQRLYGLVFRLVGNRAEAEDIVQDVFLRLHQKPPNDERNEHNVSAWLYRVATNTAYNAIRSRNRLWQRNQHLVPDKSDGSAGPEKAAEQQEEAQLVRAALAELSPMHGQLLLLRQLGLSYTELAEACDVNPNSVGKTLSRAAEAFRKAYLRLSVPADAEGNNP